MDLVTQQEALILEDLNQNSINADLKGRDFDRGWALIPITLKIQFAFIIPIFVVYLYLFGTREIIAEHIAVDDLPSRDEIFNYDEQFEKFDKLLIDNRDKRLIDILEGLLKANDKGKKSIGIVYGAMHMRNIMAYLLEKQGYRIADSEWVTVFDL